MRTVLSLLLLLALASRARAEDDDREPDDEPAIASEPEADLAVLAPVAAPAIGEVLEAAYGAAGLDRDPARSFRRRTRLAGLVPWLSVRFGRNLSWNDLEPEIDHHTTVEVRATWRLDRLVFDGRELQVSSLDTARRRERRRLAAHVIRTYFAWRRLAAATARRPALALRAEEVAAELDALTDGWFTGELARRR